MVAITQQSLSALLFTCLGAAALAAEAVVGTPPTWADINPIVTRHCVMCHSAQGAGKGLRLDSYALALAGSTDGPVLLPGDPEGSELIRRLKGISSPRMPFLSYPLADDEIALFVRWVEAGMPER
ncbi:MAG TPA: c-type cytochrome domain-containing protein [Devosia sp.]|uniref:c-type cytochrome domain-containing protein n=1 Tax=Devosia sp. TaxID=1871048 RepID=UPI002DDC92C7|nr:c-type cytochrome domain-containing protein [Devosia sp.]HEV2516730.1 c-type cytochrome domain-containing protein [Devosia sp.]